VEHDEEGETDDINEGDAENDEKGEEGVGGPIDTRILEEMRDISCKFFDVLPTPADNVANRQIDVSIFLQKIFRSSSTNYQQSSLVERRLQHFVLHSSGTFSWVLALQVACGTKSQMSPHSDWPVRA